MTFVTLLFLLTGLLLLFSAIENQSIIQYAQTWIGGGS